MKKTYFVISFLFLLTNLIAQKVEWVKQIKTTAEYPNPAKIISDEIGNTYSIVSKYLPGNYHLSELIKLNKAGEEVWRINTSCIINKIELYKNNYLYICGSIEGNVTLGNFTLNANGSDAFIAKMDSSGNFLWAHIPSQNFNQAQSLACDWSGNPLITGSTEDTLHLAKYDTLGNILHLKSFENAQGWELSFSQGAFYLLGKWDKTVVFSTQFILSDTSEFVGYHFIAKLDINTEVLWIKNLGSNYYQPHANLTANNGSFYLSKWQRYGAFILAKFDSIGNLSKFQEIIESYNIECESIRTDKKMNVYLTGEREDPDKFKSWSNHSFLVKLNSSGIIEWELYINNSLGKSVTTDSFGNIYLIGYLSQPTSILGHFLDPVNGNMFIAKLLPEKCNVNVNFSALGNICVDQDSLLLSGGFPANGVYSGKGVRNGYFYPSEAGIAEHGIIYTYTDTSGCSNSASQKIKVISCNCSVSLSSLNPVCKNVYSIPLSGGNPLGGIYSGKAVNGDKFFPMVAGIGEHLITYNYTDSFGCSSSANQTIKVENCSALSAELGVFSPEIQVYPNPGTGVFTLEIPNFVPDSYQKKAPNIEIYNILGELIKNVSYNSMPTLVAIDLSAASKGIYFLKISGGKERFTQKIVLQ